MDCGNGCAGTVVPQVFERMGTRVVPLFAELDGRFPEPPAGSDGAGAAARPDRRGARDRRRSRDRLRRRRRPHRRRRRASGRIVLRRPAAGAARARRARRGVPGAEIIFDVKCSQGLVEDIAAHGGRPSMWKTGHSLIKQRLHGDRRAARGGDVGPHVLQRGLLRLRRRAVRGRASAALRRRDRARSLRRAGRLDPALPRDTRDAARLPRGAQVRGRRRSSSASSRVATA